MRENNKTYTYILLALAIIFGMTLSNVYTSAFASEIETIDYESDSLLSTTSLDSSIDDSNSTDAGSGGSSDDSSGGISSGGNTHSGGNASFDVENFVYDPNGYYLESTSFERESSQQAEMYDPASDYPFAYYFTCKPFDSISDYLGLMIKFEFQFAHYDDVEKTVSLVDYSHHVNFFDSYENINRKYIFFGEKYWRYEWHILELFETAGVPLENTVLHSFSATVYNTRSKTYGKTCKYTFSYKDYNSDVCTGIEYELTNDLGEVFDSLSSENKYGVSSLETDSEFLKYPVDYIKDSLSAVREQLKSLMGVAEEVANFAALIGAIFVFLPSSVIAILSSMLVLMGIIGVYKLIKG